MRDGPKGKGTSTDEPPQEVLLDPGVSDKRLQLFEEELSYTIKQAHRRGNTLIEASRQTRDSSRAGHCYCDLLSSCASNQVAGRITWLIPLRNWSGCSVLI